MKPKAKQQSKNDRDSGGTTNTSAQQPESPPQPGNTTTWRQSKRTTGQQPDNASNRATEQEEATRQWGVGNRQRSNRQHSQCNRTMNRTAEQLEQWSNQATDSR
jgi:hypothetical protein